MTGQTSPTAQVDPIPESPNVGGSRKPVDVESAQRVLRSSARMLEELAAELEVAQFYDKADELRRTAAKYWLEARSID